MVECLILKLTVYCIILQTLPEPCHTGVGSRGALLKCELLLLFNIYHMGVFSIVHDNIFRQDLNVSRVVEYNVAILRRGRWRVSAG